MIEVGSTQADPQERNRPAFRPIDMLKGFTHARLACGCQIGFRGGVDGSPVLLVVESKSPQCASTQHVAALPPYDYRESMRPATRLGPPEEEEYEEEACSPRTIPAS